MLAMQRYSYAAQAYQGSGAQQKPEAKRNFVLVWRALLPGCWHFTSSAHNATYSHHTTITEILMERR